MSADAALDADLRRMLASLQEETTLAGGGPQTDVLELLKQVVLEGVDNQENKLKELKEKGAKRRLVLSGSCPMYMSGVDPELLDTMIAQGKLQPPPFGQIYVKSNDGSLEACIPMGVNTQNGLNASDATANIVGRGIVDMFAKNPEATLSVECSQWTGSRESCEKESTTNCAWFSNGCFTHAFILEQKLDQLQRLEKRLAEVPQPTNGGSASEEYRELEATIQLVRKEIDQLKKAVEADKKAANATTSASQNATAQQSAPQVKVHVQGSKAPSGSKAAPTREQVAPKPSAPPAPAPAPAPSAPTREQVVEPPK